MGNDIIVLYNLCIIFSVNAIVYLFIYLFCIPVGSNSGAGFHHWTLRVSMLL